MDKAGEGGESWKRRENYIGIIFGDDQIGVSIGEEKELNLDHDGTTVEEEIIPNAVFMFTILIIYVSDRLI